MKIISLETKVIDILRFPLVVLVVLIHLNTGIAISAPTHNIFNETAFFFSECLARVAVPLFMLFSGYLFFFANTGFTKEIYYKKIKSRFHSLFIPYMIWNTVAVLITLGLHLFFPEMVSGSKKPMTEYTLSDWFYSYWNTNEINSTLSSPCPTNYPLWFIRDLMIISLFSPIIYWLVKRLKWISIIVIGLLHITDALPTYPGFCLEAIFYFTVGALFGVHKIDFCQYLKNKATPLTIAFIVTIVLREMQQHEMLSFLNSSPISMYRLMILTGSCTTIAILAQIAETKSITPNKFLSNSSFFVYLYHALPLGLTIKLLLKLDFLNCDIGYTFIYFISCAIIVMAGIYIYKIALKLFPRTSAFIMGGRQ
jgi:surface polysaccharide O-acyltransferase-like enzyme